MSDDLIKSIKTFLDHRDDLFSSSDFLEKSNSYIKKFRAGLSLEDDPKNRTQVFEDIIQSPNRLNVLSGPPGSAKTYLAAAVMDFFAGALQQNVVGLCVSSQAAQRLSEKSGIACHTLNGYLENPQVIPEQSIVVIDEVGLLGSDDLINILHHGQKKQWKKLLLLGDYRQESHESGEQPLLTIEEQFPHLWLTLNVGFRQKTSALREFVTNLYNAEANKALQVLEDSQNLIWVSGHEETIDEAVMSYLKWRSEGDNGDRTALILTQAEEGAVEANEMIQARIRTFSKTMKWDLLNGTHALSVKEAQGLAMDHSFVALTQKVTGQQMVSACSRHRYGIQLIVDRSIYQDIDALSADANNFKLDEINQAQLTNRRCDLI